MTISEFGYQRAVGQIDKVSDLCRRASLKTQNPAFLRELREIRNEAEVVKETLAEYTKLDPVKPRKGGGSAPGTDSESPGDGPASA